MAPRRWSWLTTGLSVVGATALLGQVRPPEPHVERGVCPFECCTYRDWTADSTIRVYREEGSRAAVALLLARGDTFQAVTGNVHIVRLGIVRMRRPYTVFSETDARPPNVLDTIPLGVNDTAYVLSYRGEGYYDVWIRGQVHAVAAFWDDRRLYPRPTGTPGVLVQEPDERWWVQIRTRDGRTGWILMSEAAVSGADACG